MELGKLILDTREIKERQLSNFEQALLDGLWHEIQRIYWNNYQTELDGYGGKEDDEKIFGDIKWIPYDWSDEPTNEPNLTINGKNFWWYKYFGRSMTTDSEEKLSEEWYEDSYNKILDCDKDF